MPTGGAAFDSVPAPWSAEAIPLGVCVILYIQGRPRRANCGYKETRWLGMHKQAGTRAGSHLIVARVRCRGRLWVPVLCTVCVLEKALLL